MPRILRALVVACLALGALIGPAAAAKPEIARVPINDIGVLQVDLSLACGFSVWADTSGHITFHTWLNASGDPVREVNNYALSSRYYSQLGSVRVRDVGVDRITWLSPTELIQVIIGNVQSINVPGRGRIFADVGQSTYHITLAPNGDVIDVEQVDSSGQHDPDQFAVLCEVLGP